MEIIKLSEQDTLLAKMQQKAMEEQNAQAPHVDSMTTVTLPIDSFINLFKSVPQIPWKERRDTFARELWSAPTPEYYKAWLRNELKDLTLWEEMVTLNDLYNQFQNCEI